MAVSNESERPYVFAHYHKGTGDNYEQGVILALTKWRLMLGVKEKPSQEELKMNLAFIQQNYKELTVRDIVLAMNKSLTGELGVDANLYDKGFSPIYISRILNAYKVRLTEIVNEVIHRQKQEEQKQKNTDKPLTKAEAIQQHKDLLRWFFAHCINNAASKFIIDLDSGVWNFLCRRGEISNDGLHSERASKFADEMYTNDSNTKLFFKLTAQQRKEDMSEMRQSYGRHYIIHTWVNLNFSSEDEINSYILAIKEDEIILSERMQSFIADDDKA